MSKWTRIDERLPDWSGAYLLWDGKNMCVCPLCTTFAGGGRYWGYGSDFFEAQFATHWRPLPEPPA